MKKEVLVYDLKTNQMFTDGEIIGKVINVNAWVGNGQIEVLYTDDLNGLHTCKYNENMMVEIIVEEIKEEVKTTTKKSKMTVANLVRMAKAEIEKEGYTISDLNDNCLCELAQETNKAMIEASDELVKITSKEWSLMDRNNNPYGEYDTIEQAKHSILHDVVSYILEGNNTTVLKLKKKILSNIIG
jgi:hypothetical protein